MFGLVSSKIALPFRGELIPPDWLRQSKKHLGRVYMVTEKNTVRRKHGALTKASK